MIPNRRGETWFWFWYPHLYVVEDADIRIYDTFENAWSMGILLDALDLVGCPVFLWGWWRNHLVCWWGGKWGIKGMFIQRGMTCCSFSTCIAENIHIFMLKIKLRAAILSDPYFSPLPSIFYYQPILWIELLLILRGRFLNSN